MKVRVVDEEREFRALAAPWKELEAAGAVKDITTTWEWMFTWWQIFNQDRRLYILVVEEGDCIVGIVPLQRRRIRYFGLLPYLRLEFLGSGEREEDEILSEYLGLVMEEGHKKESLDLIFSFLFADKGGNGWEEILLPRMNEETGDPQEIGEKARAFGLGVEIIENMLSIYAPLPSSWDEYLRQLSSNARQQVRRGFKELDRLGKVSFRLAEGDEEINRAKRALLELHQSRWRARGKPGVFSSERFNLFHERIMKIARENSWLRLSTLCLDEEPIACLYNFQFGEKVYFYQSGVKTFNNNHLRPGLLAHCLEIRQCIEEGKKEYDFLAGASQYKRTLGKGERQLTSLRISRVKPKEKLYKTARYLRLEAASAIRCWKGEPKGE